MKTIFKTIFGSHLYGTDTPTSDKDYKGIFVEEIENIILKKDKEVIHQNTRTDKREGVRNSPDDIDTEYKELRRFLKDCMSGQTYALDMIFAPDKFWLEHSREWVFILAHREKLLSKNVQPYIGYCRQQAGKYGLKGSRLGELLRVVEYLRGFDPKLHLYEVIDGLRMSEFVKETKIECPRPNGESPIMEQYLDILGKKFQLTRNIKEILPALEKMNEKYGDRARQAQKNEGVDWKAISHAYRCCYQLKELAMYGGIRFPLEAASHLKRLKKGEISYDVVQAELPLLMDSAVNEVTKSTHLPEQPDYEFWDNFIVKTYAPHPIETP